MSLAFTILIAGLSSRVDEPLVTILSSQGYIVRTTLGPQALLATLSRSLDLVILDVAREEELCYLPAVRSACSCALMVLGPARDDRLVVAALEQGADEYVPRPFRVDELLARIRAQLRRRERSDGRTLAFGPLSIDPYGRQAARDGQPLNLGPEEFALLATLASRPGFACPAALLLEQVWGSGMRDDMELLAATVGRLRELIEPDPEAPVILGGSIGLGYWLGGISRERELTDQTLR